MLTGVLPFPGFTTAQLAVQHMHSPPLLGPLPEADRPTIGRALSKQPEPRIPTCRQMVDCLLGVVQRTAASGELPAHSQPESATTARSTVDLRSTPCGSHLDETSNHRDSSVAGEPAVEDHELTASPLPPLEMPDDGGGVRPTVVVGIGGSAARILRKLRRRLHERFGDRSAAPSFQLLLIDTDPHTLRVAEQGDPEEALIADETVFVPLRKPAEYRAASDKILGWLSRRWLYNIPRSLRTEGLRPLGRLAYVNQTETIKERIRQAIAEAASHEALTKTTQTAGVGVRNAAPRVFVISSISGGAGSGMLLDVAYAVRGVLGEMGFDNNEVCGILAHSTLNKCAANDLRKANAYATLPEL